MAVEDRRTRFRIAGMDCAGCAAKIDTAVRQMPGVRDVSLSVIGGTMTVTHGAGTDLDGMARRLGGLGYAAIPAPGGGRPPASGQPYSHGDGHGHDHGPQDGRWWQGARARLTLVCGAALALAFVMAQLFPATRPTGFILAMAVGLIPIARRALAGARAGSPFSIETLMTVAAVGAVIIGASEEAAVVIVLFLVGELLEGIAAGRARASIRALSRLMPETALLEAEGGTREVPAASLTAGATVMVRPGDRIPADGRVLSGESGVDEAPVTGESVPRRKAAGDDVFAGTVNQDGVLRIRVTAAAADNTIARIVRLVEEAQEARAPTARFIDRFARIYTPGVMVVALLVALLLPLLAGADWNVWIYRGLAVLLIGCPCALVISTPAAIAAALSAGARRGLLVKGGAVLERLGRVDLVAFDKTGTLTEGRPKVTDILGAGLPPGTVLRYAAALEAGSSHPLAVAILARAAAEGIAVAPAEDARALGGRGVTGRVDGVELFLAAPAAAALALADRGAAALPAAIDGIAGASGAAASGPGAGSAAGQAPMPAKPAAEIAAEIAALADAGKTVSVLLADGRVAGLVAMRDEPRADAAAGIAALARLGAGAVMLTGDTARTAAGIAAGLGIEARAGLLPQDKQRIVGELRAAGHVVAKVGDGINDAPALAAADIGIAMGGGADVALETADAAILHGRVADVAGMIGLSRAAMANIVQNITIALGLKAVFLVTTVLGITGLWPAILADTGATVLVTANAMRLLAWRGTAG